MKKFYWDQHEWNVNKATAEEKAVDRDPENVLANVSEQTGLTYRKEKRRVEVLHLSEPEQK